MTSGLVLGIDTSNYTTSAALCTYGGEILLNAKIPLGVKEGERGLRQSDAVFLHTKNLPEAAGMVRGRLAELDGPVVTAVAVSYAPRDAEGSYMPCFLAGVSAAETAAATLQAPVMYYSHQAGHIMAAVRSACSGTGTDVRRFLESEFIAFHVSGGTTDVLLCRPSDRPNRMGTRVPFTAEKIGGTLDINCGQAVDRAGVMMGMSFPCGAEMDGLALGYEGKVPRTRLNVRNAECNLSGLENKAAELYGKTGDRALTSAFVLRHISDTLSRMTENVQEQFGKLPVIYSGGVMSSGYIRKELGRYGMFAEPAMSSDNACGTALLGAYYGK